MKIYTKTGDKGQTSLIGGTRVPKYHDRIEAYGTIDELNSFIGLLRDHLPSDDSKRDILLNIQEKLFRVESHLAEDTEGGLDFALPSIEDNDIALLETEMDSMNELLPELTHFILPGGNILSSYCHVARTICRRAERISTRLSTNFHVNEIDLKYLNRLSDYFFVLSRYYTLITKSEEIIWNPRQ